MKTLSLSLILTALLLLGCSTNEYSFLDYGSKSKQLVSCYAAADSLVEQLNAKKSFPAGILRTDFFDLDQSSRKSYAGRLYSDAVASRLAQRGYQLIDPEATNELMVNRHDQQQAAKQPKANQNYAHDANASALLTGYFKRGPGKNATTVYIKIMNKRDNSIIASEEYEIED